MTKLIPTAKNYFSCPIPTPMYSCVSHCDPILFSCPLILMFLNFFGAAAKGNSEVSLW